MKNNNYPFRISFISSIILHLLIIYFFLFGIPSFFTKAPEEQVITFEMLPVSSKSNVKNKTKESEKVIENKVARKIVHSKPETVKEKKLEPVEEKKSPPKKEAVEKKKVNDKNDLDSLLKNLEQSSEGTNPKTAKKVRLNDNSESQISKGSYDDTLSLSISEISLIKQQIEQYWNIPLGVQNIEEARVILYLALKQDGSIQEVKINKAICPNMSSNACAALTNSAVRAIWQASPIKNLDPKRYNIWKEFNFDFNPSNISR